ncbi:MAG: PilW family protein [Pseudomonadota bacterium]
MTRKGIFSHKPSIKRLSFHKGLTLVELMVALALGALVAVSIVQALISNRLSDDLNKSIASAQENGRFIMTRLRNDLLNGAYYDPLSADLNRDVDVTEEAAFLRANFIPLPGTYASRAELGSIEGADANSDTLVIAMQGLRDCRGYKLGYDADEEFFVVNEYFLENNSLKCRGFDGRWLRGQKGPEGHNGHASVTLMENVLDFQVMYGITRTDVANTGGSPVRYIDASELAGALASNAYIVALKTAVIIKGDGDGFVSEPATFKIFEEDKKTAPDRGLYKAFQTTITLRNANYFVRGNI